MISSVPLVFAQDKNTNTTLMNYGENFCSRNGSKEIPALLIGDSMVKPMHVSCTGLDPKRERESLCH